MCEVRIGDAGARKAASAGELNYVLQCPCRHLCRDKELAKNRIVPAMAWTRCSLSPVLVLNVLHSDLGIYFTPRTTAFLCTSVLGV